LLLLRSHSFLLLQIETHGSQGGSHFLSLTCHHITYILYYLHNPVSKTAP
jgi:hypothetical protein